MSSVNNPPSDAWLAQQHEKLTQLQTAAAAELARLQEALADLQLRITESKQELAAEKRSQLASLVMSAADELAKQRQQNRADCIEELAEERQTWRRQLAEDCETKLAEVHKAAADAAREQCESIRRELETVSAALIGQLQQRLDDHLQEQRNGLHDVIAELKQTAVHELSNEVARLQTALASQSEAVLNGLEPAFAERLGNWQEQLDASGRDALERLQQDLEQAVKQQQERLDESAKSFAADWREDMRTQLAPLGERLDNLEHLSGTVADIRRELSGAKEKFGKFAHATKTVVAHVQSRTKADIERLCEALRRENDELKQSADQRQSQLAEQQRQLEELLRAQQQENLAIKNWLATASLRERLLGRYPPE